MVPSAPGTPELMLDVLDAMSQHVCVLDEAGVVVFVNQAWRDFAAANGGTEAVLAGCDYLGACLRASGDGAADARRFAEGLRQVLSRRAATFRMDYPCHSPTVERWFVVNVRALARGERLLAVVVHEDVTPLKRAEGELLAKKEVLKRAQRVAGVGSWDLDVRSGALRASDQALAIYGLDGSPEPVSFRRVQAMADAADRRRLDEALRALLAEGRPYDVQFRIRRHSDGAPRWIHGLAECQRDQAGQPQQVVGVIQDVTERLAATEELADRERRLRMALEASRQVEWDYDARADRITVGAGTPLGRELEQNALTAEAWRALLHPEDWAAAWAAVRAALRGPGDAFDTAARMRGRDGQWRWLRLRGQVVERDPEARAVRLIGTAMDVTGVRELEQRLGEATRLASLGTLVGGLSHQLNNPLAAVTANVGFAAEQVRGVLGATGLPPAVAARARDALDSLRDATEGTSRIGQIVSDMRVFSERPDPEPRADPARAAARALKLASHALEGRAVALDGLDGLPAVALAEADLALLLAHLLVNAGQATEATRGAVLVRGGREGGFAVLTVVDQGPGMPPEVARRAFEPFFSTRPVTARGLGLAVVHRLVTQAGGEARIESALGSGTRVVLRVPLAPEGPGSRSPSPVGT